jgi:hypothetical protein
MVRGCAAVLVAALTCVPLAAAPQDGKSSELAKQLTQMLDAKKMDSIAAADSQNLGTYVAALYIPGSQLLVVSAKYPAPPLLNEKIGNKQYRDVYIDLNSASPPETKMFVIDMNADGLLARPPEGQGADSYTMGDKASTFDGEWKKAKISEADYTKSYADADGAYAHALELLIDQMKTAGT